MISVIYQRGSTLLVALIMLMLLTLIAISAMSATTNSILVVGNAQFREEAYAAGQRAIENVMSSADFINPATPPTPQSIDINLDGTPDYTVTFEPPPICTSYYKLTAAEVAQVPVCASDPSIGAICYWTTWDVTASVTDATNSTNVVIHQGVRTVAGLNAATNLCGV